MTIDITGDFTVRSDQTFASTSDVVFDLTGSVPEESLTNHGLIQTTYLTAISTSGSAPASSQLFNDGMISVDTHSGSAIGIDAAGWSPSLSNHGRIEVSSSASATAALFSAPADVQNDYFIYAKAIDRAVALELDGGGSVRNSDTIEADSLTSAQAVAIDFEHTGSAQPAYLLNTSIISASNQTGSGCVAIWLGHNTDAVIDNQGELRSSGTGVFGDLANTVSLTNSGLIYFSVDLSSDYGQSIVTNSGRITGDVHFGSANSIYDGRGGGVVSGAVFGGAGDDSLMGGAHSNIFHGGDGGDTLRGGAGADQLFGDNGDDVLVGGAGNDTLDGGAGHDYVVYTDAPSAVAVDLAAGTASGGDGTDTLSGIEGIYGTAFNDSLLGDANRNDIHGGDGGDTIVGNAGDDVLYGEGGDDVLLGGPGDDILDGGAGHNYTCYSDAPSAVAIDLNITDSYQGTGGAGSDWLINIQDVFGSAFNDTIVGDGANNHLFGWTGGDSLSGGGGADDITGGADADVLTGGAGNDTFYYDALSDSTLAAPDLITDFSPGDRIYLTGIDADSVTPGDQAFHVGATPGHTGDIVVSYDGVHDKTTLWLYVDSDATPDGRITLLGDHSGMTAADFGL